MHNKPPELIEGKDYYINEQDLFVFTADYHLARGYCCQSGCLHCPYGFKRDKVGLTDVNPTNNLLLSTDQMGNEVSIPFPPKRIISLVPSQTELLFDLGLETEIIGATKFCIHPSSKTRSKEKIGGTKKFNLDKIQALQPDLIIGNKEENYPEGIQSLQQDYPVWMSDILTLSDACAMIREVGRITNRMQAGNVMVEEIINRFDAYLPLNNQLRAAYFIWREPYMVAGSETFIHEMMTRFGVTNVFGHKTRYPEVSMDEVIDLKPQLIFLSSEPYPFHEKHVDEFKEIFPSAKVIIIDGQFFSWYGSRLLMTPGYFEELKARCS
ncbi:MAG TPA: helical backbone metal receptor [Saprospiraceae bacterium]|nr:helical backbone metal receptor [Saprospiraceae bacterium]